MRGRILPLPALLALFLANGQVMSGAPGPIDAAHQTLQDALHGEIGWIKVHAAEVLLIAGETKAVAAVFRLENEIHGQEVGYRVGIWRVLALACPAERAFWRDKMMAVFLDSTASDRLFAVESLAKLGDPQPPKLKLALDQWGSSATPAERVFADWLDWQQGDETARVRVIKALRSPDAVARLRAAYILRKSGCADPMALGALRAAAAVEPLDSVGRPYVIGAAFALSADPGRQEAWRVALEDMAHHGTAAAAHEALQAFQRHCSNDDIRRIEPLLKSIHGDVRVGAAWTILAVARRANYQASAPSGIR